MADAAMSEPIMRDYPFISLPVDTTACGIKKRENHPDLRHEQPPPPNEMHPLKRSLRLHCVYLCFPGIISVQPQTQQL